jgi:hypothetical protein
MGLKTQSRRIASYEQAQASQRSPEMEFQALQELKLHSEEGR